MKPKNQRLIELINNQIKDIDEDDLLSWSDMRRIVKYSDKSIFGSECSRWSGYITFNKIKYVNFYFKSKKRSITRLLYINYKGNLDESKYLNHTCNNPSDCININHIQIKKNNDIQKPYVKPVRKIIYFD